MRLRAAVALVTVALALPMLAQHGTARGGFSGHSGFTGHAGFAGHAGFTGARGVVRPAPFSGQSRLARPAFGPPGASRFAGTRVPYRGSRFAAGRSQYRPAYAGRSGDWNRDHGRKRGPWIAGSYGYFYPGWGGYPYPYVIDPGFYDWGASGDSGYGSDASAGAYPDAAYTGDQSGPGTMEAPNYAQGPLQAPASNVPPSLPAYADSIQASQPEQAITVIFKNGRAPQTIQNYLMTSRTLTDLDQQHYEQIPLDQIDIEATEQSNRARGLDFQVPSVSR